MRGVNIQTLPPHHFSYAWSRGGSLPTIQGTPGSDLLGAQCQRNKTSVEAKAQQGECQGALVTKQKPADQKARLRGPGPGDSAGGHPCCQPLPASRSRLRTKKAEERSVQMSPNWLIQKWSRSTQNLIPFNVDADTLLSPREQSSHTQPLCDQLKKYVIYRIFRKTIKIGGTC